MCRLFGANSYFFVAIGAKRMCREDTRTDLTVSETVQVVVTVLQTQILIE